MANKPENSAFELLSSRKTLVMATADKNGIEISVCLDFVCSPLHMRLPPPQHAASNRHNTHQHSRWRTLCPRIWAAAMW